jgi:hypothetical protein
LTYRTSGYLPAKEIPLELFLALDRLVLSARCTLIGTVDNVQDFMGLLSYTTAAYWRAFVHFHIYLRLSSLRFRSSAMKSDEFNFLSHTSEATTP